MELVLEQVSKVVDGEVHLEGIDLRLTSGSLHVLLGQTLSGKTSLMRLLAGLDRPSAGTLRLDGADLTRVPVWRRRVAMVYQQFINYPHLTIYENIAFPLRRAGLDAGTVEARVRETAARLKIDAFLERRPGELSGGQQQRVALARSLVKDSDLLLLDEPLVNLDYKLREQLRDEFREIFELGSRSIVVYATTEPAEALMLGGQVAVLDQGRLLQAGPTHEVYWRPADVEVARVFNDPPMNMIGGRVKGGTARLGGDLEVPLEGHLEGLDAGRYRFGIRAGDLGLYPIGERSIGFEATVELAEINGSETFVHVGHREVSWIIQEEGVHGHALGQRFTAYLDPGQLYVFAEDGALVRGPAGGLSGAEEARGDGAH